MRVAVDRQLVSPGGCPPFLFLSTLFFSLSGAGSESGSPEIEGNNRAPRSTLPLFSFSPFGVLFLLAVC